MKTISELNTKWWYRLLKVAYLLSYIAFALALVGVAFDAEEPYLIADEDKSTLVCRSGNKKTFSYKELQPEISIYDLKAKSVNTQSLASLCDIDGPFGEKYKIDGTPTISRNEVKSLYTRIEESVDSEAERIQWATNVQSNVEFNLAEKTVGSWWGVIKFSLLLLTILTITYEFIRRIFYYIVLGTVRPKKNHESDTILP
ncbi:MAG: hypothetical protein KBD44_00625 [Candidatus Pacebacteria bacterium]|nr:hypothetical protein [Candidatus Paceibacterota bacterium]